METKEKQSSPIKKLEVLAPAGSFSHLIAAVNAGADAVYFGAGEFNARRGAVNFTEQEVKKAVSYCHQRNVKAYGTLNTLVTDRELSGALKTAHLFYEAGADALILQDLGLVRHIREYFPEIRMTASTQMAVHSLEGVKQLESLGFSRVVLARELSFQEVKYICENSSIEIEVFAHGALCMCISGQCYFSSVIGQRSGNRGKCAQPCRLPYEISGKSGYPLSLKDLFYGDKLNKLSEIGVSSIKIEGRMKSTEYVSAVTAAYQEAAYTGFFHEKKKNQLAVIFSRNGFTDGYFDTAIGKQMFGIRSEDDKRLTKAADRKAEFPTKEETENQIETQYSPVLIPNVTLNRQNNKREKPSLQYKFRSVTQIPDAINKDSFIWLELFDLVKQKEKLQKYLEKGYSVGISLPPFIGDTHAEKLTESLKQLKSLGIAHLLTGNLGQLKLAIDFGFSVHTDMEMNVFNSFSLKELTQLGAVSSILSPELSFPQIRDMEKAINTGIIAYGRLPLMTTRACILKSNLGCEQCTGRLDCKDRRNEVFPVFKDFGCINRLYNAHPLYIGDKKEYEQLGLSFVRLDFTTEKKAEVDKIITMFRESRTFPGKFTRGLYARGVE